jgi:hypothetical protein
VATFKEKFIDIKGAILLLAIAIPLLAIGFANCYQKISSTGLHRTIYEGQIIDKSATLRESRFGSSIIRKLLIENKNGSRFEIIVSPEVYERAQIGKQIKSNKSGVEILQAETTFSNSSY